MAAMRRKKQPVKREPPRPTPKAKARSRAGAKPTEPGVKSERSGGGLALQLFEPNPEAAYALELVERLAHVPRRMILIYYRHGLVAPVGDPAQSGFCFNDAGIRALRRIEYLRTVCGINLVGIKMIFDLAEEAERLRAEARFLRRR